MTSPFDWCAWAEQASTGLGLVDRHLCLVWLNPALAEALELGPRRGLGQPLAALLGEPTVATHAARARDEQRAVHWRELRLGAASRHLDATLQPFDRDTLVLEVHVLAPRHALESPVSASLRGFAHEVKNPLAGLRGAAQLLQRRVATDELAALAGVVIDEADRLAALADRLLRGGGAARHEPVNIHAVLDRVTTLLAAEPAPLALRTDYDPSLPDLRGDADRLQQLLLNLTRNAREAGAHTLTLRTRAEHAVRVAERSVRTALRLDVIDDGPGVPPALSASLFEPLVSGRADGTGLGLALAREIAREHRGELRHAGAPGHTVFSLLLPLEPA